ncbi:replication factor RFC1 C terminal domain-containing protein, partial [Melampsora americana]
MADIRSFFGKSGSSDPSKAIADPKSPNVNSKPKENTSTSTSTPTTKKTSTPKKNSPAKTMKPTKPTSSSTRKPQGTESKSLPNESSSLPRTSKITNKRKMCVEISESDDDQPVKSKASSTSKSKEQAKPKEPKPTERKRKAKDDDFIDDDDDDDDDDDVPVKSKTTKPPSSKKAKPDNGKSKGETSEVPAGKPKPKWIPGQQRAGPSAPGSKEIPEGQPNCLAGLTFVFTGELESLSREEAQTLCKRYGGRVTTSPSSKTSYVVLGSDAGQKKLEVIAKHKITTLTEDEFLELIGTRSPSEIDPKVLKKQQDEIKKIKQAAKAMEPTKGSTAEKAQAKQDLAGQLWPMKYAPKALNELCGNKTQVEKLQNWLRDWPKNRKAKFTKPGKDGLGLYRCVVLSGPPGVGKTTTAHLVSKLEGYDIIEMNASNTRSKKLLEAGCRDITGNTGIGGFLESSEPKNEKLVLIMDEVDGMSAGDRGGVGALNALIRKTRVPIIAIANDMSLQKMKPLKSTTHSLVFRRPDANAIRSRIMCIAFREKLKVPAQAIDQLVAGSQSDIRQIINMLSVWKLQSGEGPSKPMEFDDARKMALMNEKNTIASPWSLVHKLFSPQTWAQASSMSFMDKCDLYFQDHDMLPLFVQDGYTKHECGLARNYAGPEKAAKKLELLSKAADSISDGDLVDRMIHGPQQHWSLMPIHGVFSCIRPAYFCHGPSTSSGFQGGGGGGFGFPAWFGKNSTQTKLNRLLGEIQIRMRLKISADRREVLMSYLPNLVQSLIEPLKSSNEGIEKVIEVMDEYFLTKEEWDSLVELMSIGITAEEVLKQIPSTTKSAFTRKLVNLSSLSLSLTFRGLMVFFLFRY